jgi:hypothetical protein
LRNNSRNFGLAFAAALSVHLGLVAFLCATGSLPDAKTFLIFGTAAAFVYLLAFLSIPRVQGALPNQFWPLIRSFAMNYIAFAFLKDFARPGIVGLGDILYGSGHFHMMYVPFAGLAFIAPMLRLAAWIQKIRQGQPSKLPTDKPLGSKLDQGAE